MHYVCRCVSDRSNKHLPFKRLIRKTIINKRWESSSERNEELSKTYIRLTLC